MKRIAEMSNVFIIKKTQEFITDSLFDKFIRPEVVETEAHLLNYSLTNSHNTVSLEIVLRVYNHNFYEYLSNFSYLHTFRFFLKIYIP